MPTTPDVAFKIGGGEEISASAKALADLYTIGANAAGLPAISTPCGLTTEGLPFGIQLIGPQLQERCVLHVSDALEQETKSASLMPSKYLA